mgnify:CR=1 FL=1
MLRVLHTADVHLGARHPDLGEQAPAQRERQFAALARTIDLATAERVDLVLVCGDLFDSNAQPRRTVERAATELGRLVAARIRTVLIPGIHDVYDRASVYRAYDLAELAGAPEGSDLLTVLTPERPSILLPALDAVVYGRVLSTARASESPLAGFDVRSDERAAWKIGMIHGSLAIPGRTDPAEVVFTREEVEASGLDYLALGHWHSTLVGKAGRVQYAYSGAPEPVALEQDEAGRVLLVELSIVDGVRRVSVAQQQVGRTRFEKLDVLAGSIVSQSALVADLGRRADPDLILDARLTGVRPDELELVTAEVEAALAGSFLKIRVRDRSVASLGDGPAPPPDTVVGAFTRDLEARIVALEGEGRDEEAAEAREALRVGRLLLAGREVVP